MLTAFGADIRSYQKRHARGGRHPEGFCLHPMTLDSRLRGHDKMRFQPFKTVECPTITYVQRGSQFVFGQE
jgi:hypothetical protein